MVLHLFRKRARDQGTALATPDDFQYPSNYARTIAHDVQTHAVLIVGSVRDSRTVVADAENSPAIYTVKFDGDVPSVAVFDRVMNCLLRDAIQMIGGCVVVDQNRVVAFESAGDLKQIFHLAGPMLQRAHQTQRIG